MADEDEVIETEEILEPTEVETRALSMGWKPEEEWDENGPGSWLPADEFIERQERLTKRADAAAQKEIASLRAEIRDMRSTFSEFKDFHSKTEQRAYERAMSDLESRARAAAAEGDVEAYDRASGEMKELQKDLEAAKPKDAAQSPDDIPAFKEWLSENRWYETDPVLSVKADEIARKVARNLDHSTREFYDAVTEAMKRAYPEEMGVKPQKRGSPVEGGSPTTRRKGGKTYDDLPADAKAACDKFVKRDLMTREQYVKDYEWES